MQKPTRLDGSLQAEKETSGHLVELETGLGKRSLFPVLPLPSFPKVIHTLPPSLPPFSVSPSPFAAWSPSQSLHPLAPRLAVLSSALAVCHTALLWQNSALRG